MIKKCKECGKNFRVFNSRIKMGRGKYCSKKCWKKHKLKSVFFRNCLFCKKNFKTYDCRIKNNEGKFCSRKCADLGNRKGEWRECLICGNIFWGIPYHIKKQNHSLFCSKSCAGFWKMKNMNTTKSEKMIEVELKKYPIKYKHPFQVYNVALIDFLLPNKIIIQSDGKWHRFKNKIERDKKQDMKLKFLGFQIFRLPSNKRQKYISKFIEKIIEKI